MRIEFSENKDPDCTQVILEGCTLGYFQSWDKQGSLAKLVEESYRRGEQAMKNQMQRELRTLIGIGKEIAP